MLFPMARKSCANPNPITTIDGDDDLLLKYVTIQHAPIPTNASCRASFRPKTSLRIPDGISQIAARALYQDPSHKIVNGSNWHEF